MTAHHRHAPSGAEQWFNCPGSLNKSDGLYEPSSEYSSEGTAAHTIRERCLNEGTDVADYLGEWVPADDLFFEVTPDWSHWLQPGIDRIREAKGFTWSFEHRTEMDPWIPGGFGTLDAGGYSKDLIIIDDLKFGQGILVEAERNKQLMIYALGFWNNYARYLTDATDFLIRIDQPRVAGKGDEWRTTLDELLTFAGELEAAVKRTLAPDAPLVPGPQQCRFCKAGRNLKCEVQDQFILELLGLGYDELDEGGKLKMAQVDGMTPERRAKIVAHASMISSWVNTVRAASLGAALDGNPDPGLKAVATQGDRVWRSEQEAADFWKGKIPERDLYARKLKSPAQVELVAGTRNWAKAQDLIERAEGKPALVPETDKRPALIPLIDLLDDLDDELDVLLDDLDSPETATEQPNNRTTEQPTESSWDDLL